MRDDKRTYTNGEVTVYWEPDLCIHVMNCIRKLPGGFGKHLNVPGSMLILLGTKKKIIRGVDTCPQVLSLGN